MALVILSGLGVLLAGLWWVQVVSARDYQANLETQSFRTVRIPAVRGRILDRNGKVLAENRPTYNVSLYLDELRKPFDAAYLTAVARAKNELQRQQEELERSLKRKLTREERQPFILTSKGKGLLRLAARCQVASNVVWQIGQRLQQPLTLNLTNFKLHYEKRLALPFPVLLNLDSKNIARFEEQCTACRVWIWRSNRLAFILTGPPPRTWWAICSATTVQWKARRRFFLIGCRITAASSASKRAMTNNCAAWPGPSRFR